MRKPLCIVFDGLDCVGKTTTAKALAYKLNGEYLPWLQEPFRTAIKAIWAEPKVSENSAHLVFLGALRHLSDVIDEKLASGTTVVLDRYVFSTVAVYAPFALARGLNPLKIPLAELKLRRPDFAFMIDIDEGERTRRIILRGEDKSPPEELSQRAPDFLAKVKDGFYQQVHEGNLIHLDANNLSTDAILAKVEDEIQQRQKSLQPF